jgi:MoxR-like ATPase
MALDYYKGTNQPHDGITHLPAAPPWRDFTHEDRHMHTYQSSAKEIELVNTALLLRRPLFVTGQPGSGKSSLAYAVAHELQLGPVLRWSITSRSTLAEGLYEYDAIARLQDANLRHRLQHEGATPPDIGRYLRLGPLGTALLRTEGESPRVLLIDEIDKSDIDLPNDLLHVFEEGEYVIPELMRLPAEATDITVRTWDGDEAHITGGRVHGRQFPFVIFTSNGEREFPPAFLRRCLRLDIDAPNPAKLRQIAKAHLGDEVLAKAEPLIQDFLDRCEQGDLLATDQLLNAIYLTTQPDSLLEREVVRTAVLRSLSS